MAAFRLASKGRSIDEASYETERESILALLNMQMPSSNRQQRKLDIQPENYVSTKIAKKYKTKQVSMRISSLRLISGHIDRGTLRRESIRSTNIFLVRKENPIAARRSYIYRACVYVRTECTANMNDRVERSHQISRDQHIHLPTHDWLLCWLLISISRHSF